MVLEGDFVLGVATTPAKAITDYNVFKFPSIGGSAPAVVGGGDIVVMFKDSAAGQALVTVPGDTGGGDDRGEVRAGLLVPEQERPSERLLRRPQPGDGNPARTRGRSASTSPT